MPNLSPNSHIDISPEVQAALAADEPVVALESTIICHGMPHPQNVETARQVEQTVRDHGATPATIAVLEGRLKVGLNAKEIEQLAIAGPAVTKTSLRDLPLIVASQKNGATTVAATMRIAALAGVRVFATGGIGGVHRGGEQSLDVSADLEELARSNVAVVCAGVKSVLDIGRTLERLETLGVPVIGYQTDILPAFYTRESNFAVDTRQNKPGEVAATMRAKWELGLPGGLVVANPVPASEALPADGINQIIEDAISEMNNLGIVGKETTPFLLTRIAEATAGRSLRANIALVLNNAALAAQIAGAFCNSTR